jgi:hypothetical protein
LDIVAVLFEPTVMSITKPDSAALTVLRAMFDLAEVSMPVTRDLLVRLLGLTPHRTAALIAQLRRGGLVQLEHLRLTMAGLVLATALPETEPRQAASAPSGSRRTLVVAA